MPRPLADITPDLTTFGKVIGGGLNIGAYGGRRDVMQQVAPSGPCTRPARCRVTSNTWCCCARLDEYVLLSIDDVVARPVYSVNSGPSMAPVAGRLYAGEDRDAIVCDMGGTSFDVSVIRDGYIKFTRETWLGGMWTGHMTGLSSVDVKSIGAGGGSIAWIDSAGLLRVGPQSAGAVPGPACYGLGGVEATVTDAAVVLGYIDPDYFLGGRLKLDAERAAEAVRTSVAELGLDLERAAYSVLAVANEHMVTAIKDITINEGLDPRASIIVGGGGAGGMAIARIAEQLGCRRVLIPRTAGALSATGGLFSDVVTEFSISRRVDTNRFDFDAVNEGLAQLDGQIDEFFDRLDTRAEQRRKEFFVEARYPYQVWEIEVPLGAGSFADDGDVERMVEAFHDVHERVFAVKEPGQYVECIYWKGRATAALPKPRLPYFEANGAGPPTRSGLRRASFGSDWRRRRADLPGLDALCRPAAERAGDRRGAHHDRGRQPRVVAHRNGDRRLPPRTGRHPGMSAISRRVRSGPARRDGEPPGRDLPRDDEHAAPVGPVGGAQHCARLLLLPRTPTNELLASAEGLPIHVIGTSS